MKLFNIFIHNVVVVLIFVLVTGLCSIIYKREVYDYIVAAGQNKVKWKEIYVEFAYNDIQRYSNNILISVPVFCLLMVIGVLALL